MGTPDKVNRINPLAIVTSGGFGNTMHAVNAIASPPFQQIEMVAPTFWLSFFERKETFHRAPSAIPFARLLKQPNKNYFEN